MPAIVLTRVDLPAPLSPTRPTTSPGSTAKLTRSRAWTGPNFLLTPSISSRAVEVITSPGLGDTRFFACLGVGAGAEFFGGDEPIGDHGLLDVVFDHRDGFQQHRGNLHLAVVGFVRDLGLGEFFAFGERHGDFRRDLGLLVGGLVDGHVLLAGEDSLYA